MLMTGASYSSDQWTFMRFLDAQFPKA